jgi:chromosome segregation ATPase
MSAESLLEAGRRRLQQFQDAAAGRGSASPGYDGARLQHLELEKELLQTECIELHKILEEARRQNNRIEDEKDAMKVELEELRRSRWETGSRPRSLPHSPSVSHSPGGGKALSEASSVRGGAASPSKQTTISPSPEASPTRQQKQNAPDTSEAAPQVMHLTREREELLRRLEELLEKHRLSEKKVGELQSAMVKLQPRLDECKQLRAQLSSAQQALKETESAKHEWMKEKQKLLDRIKTIKAEVDRSGHSLKGKDAEIARLQAELRDRDRAAAASPQRKGPEPGRSGPSLTEVLQLREALEVEKSKAAELSEQLTQLQAGSAGCIDAELPGETARTPADPAKVKSPFDRGLQEQLSHTFELEARLILEEERARKLDARVAELEAELGRARAVGQKPKQAPVSTTKRPSPSSAQKAAAAPGSQAQGGDLGAAAVTCACNLADVEKRHKGEIRKFQQLVKEHGQRDEAKQLVIERYAARLGQPCTRS